MFSELWKVEIDQCAEQWRESAHVHLKKKTETLNPQEAKEILKMKGQ